MACEFVPLVLLVNSAELNKKHPFPSFLKWLFKLVNMYYQHKISFLGFYCNSKFCLFAEIPGSVIGIQETNK